MTNPSDAANHEALIISHCTLFYWWPVWVVGFIMFLVTWVHGEYMVTVPTHTTITAPKKDDKGMLNYGLAIPERQPLPTDINHPGEPVQPHLWMSANKNLGVLFVVVLLLVVVVTNIPLRGLWSVIVIGLIVTLSVVFAWLELWDKVLTTIGFLDIRINAAGYLVISSVLFVLWLFVTVIFDRQVYIVFTPKNMRVCQEVGGAEIIYGTTNMTVEKQRNDFFRHWILGFGSGDLIIKTANGTEIHMPNILFIGSRVKRIERMLEVMDVEAARKSAE